MSFIPHYPEGMIMDFYELFGVPTNADELSIRKRFRELSRRHHPDRNPDSNDMVLYAELSNAYRVLTNPAEREKYDAEQKVSRPFGFAATAGGAVQSVTLISLFRNASFRIRFTRSRTKTMWELS